MATRLYSSISVETTLGSSINSSVTSIQVATGTASTLLGGVTIVANSQFTVALDPDTINEEIVFITAGPSGDTFTVTRGRAGSSAVAHSTGATIKHVLTSDDLTAFAAGISPVSSLGFSGSTSGTTTVQATAVAGTNTLTLPATTSDTLVGKATTDILTNKTLTAPVISTIVNTGTLTLPTSTDTLVGRATTDTLTNKTLTAPKIAIGYSAKTAAYTLASGDEGYLFSMNNAATQQFNIPTDATFNFAIGTEISFVWITGAGQPTIGATTPGTTTVISTAAVTATPKLRVANSAATAIKLAANSWLVVGDIA
jgi:hypothetical protein